MKNKILIVFSYLLFGNAFAQMPANMPAARVHVKEVGGNPIKYTSKLAQVVELNFTFGNSHLLGKQVITAHLTKIAKMYAAGGKDAFTIKRFTGPNEGSGVAPVQFTLADLLSGEVIVTNNISSFNELPSRDPAEAAAFERAVNIDGRGVLGFHGTGDGGGGWSFYTNKLHPVQYNGHKNRVPAPVYKNPALEKHITLDSVLEKGTTAATVPNGLDLGGNEILTAGIKTRQMKNEWYQFGRNLPEDPTYKSLTQALLKYDPRALGTDLPATYRYKGGNVFAFILKIGAGQAAYLPPGHEDDELTLPGTTFDGGTGDYDRFVGQTLFYLAGYKTEVCGGAVNCDGLPIVTANDLLTGTYYKASTAILDPYKLAFVSNFNKKYTATVSDIRGKTVAVKNGFGRGTFEFDQSNLKAGIYFLSVKIGNAPAKVQRYALATSSH